ncbi:hypothetical protein Cni_G29237 [Canna indica]|uniref:Reverse transcriptase zinc-binding domain-containing protein n=1 Tax=Canna indica TaxID=4628 RepID=A0AAQ3LB95_9LILI|nr:hypothetical protein Cni_G29237 [Canna indica]
MSGQQVNSSKSAIMLSKHTPDHTKTAISSILSITKTNFDEKYLGLPATINRSKQSSFEYIISKITSIIQSWSSKFLSRAGRTMLIKAVLNSIPSYTMSYFHISDTICDHISRLCSQFWWSSTRGKRSIHWLKWTQLCKSFKSGGLGFRDCRAQNLALLAKQCWRIMKYPDSLLSRTLKGRYFPYSEFMNVENYNNPSGGWQSIIKGRDLIHTSIRWNIGARTTRTLHDQPWLPCEPLFSISGPQPNPLQPTLISDFFDREIYMWNTQMVQSFFSRSVADLILSVEILPSADQPHWHYSSNGEYTVASGYKIALSKMQPDVTSPHPFPWNNIWKLKVPLKIKTFLWRLLQDSLPTRTTLQSRHVPIPTDACPICKHNPEDEKHLFFTCPLASRVWKISLLPIPNRQAAPSMEA